MRKRVTDSPFVKHTRSLLESPAWQALSGDALKVLDRIELEHLRHGGKENGRLAVPYSHFEAHGLGHRRYITRALRELEALRLIVIRKGRAGNGEFRTPTLYGLTYLEPGEPWKEIKSLEEAKVRVAALRKARPRSKWLIAKSSNLVRFPAP
jgi:hypothetical protein